jgi:hypothetical protein
MCFDELCCFVWFMQLPCCLFCQKKRKKINSCISMDLLNIKRCMEVKQNVRPTILSYLNHLLHGGLSDPIRKSPACVLSLFMYFSRPLYPMPVL